MAGEGEPAIRLQIVAEGQVCPRVVKAANSGDRELVEVAGFTFIRKRTRPDIAGGAQQASPKRAKDGPSTPGVISVQPYAVVASTPGRVSQEGLLPGALPQLTVTAVEQQSDDDPDSSLTDKLLQLLPENCPTATKVQLLLVQLLQTNPSKLQAGADLESAAQQIGQRFCTLLTRHIEAARNLLIHQPGPAPPSGDGSAAGAASEYSLLAPMVRAAAEGPGLQAALAAHLAALTAEEASWLQLQQQHAAPAAAPDTPAAAAAPGTPCEGAMEGPAHQQAAVQQAEGQQHRAGEHAGVAGAGAGDNSVLAPAPVPAPAQQLVAPANPDPDCSLALAAENAYAAMATQVDMLEGEAAQAQVLIRRATQAAAHLQAQYRSDKFNGLPHLNSPQVLIRNITTRPAGVLTGMKPATPMHV